jgi:4-amino-4-deoxy-L-arabinose transferase-like glycosyltransferase
MAYLVIAYLGSDLHPDTLETWTLGRTFEWGNPKHPPLMGWMAGLWTTIFPVTDWSLQLLAIANGALGLWAVDLITRRFGSPEKRVLVLLLLMLSPIYQLHAQRFNANSVLLSVWPIATYCFLRAFEDHRGAWSAAAGVFAALALLGKYYSIFLVASFLVAAILHPERRRYFRSTSPWISAVAGLVVLAPHLIWLIRRAAASPIDYAMLHTGGGLLISVNEAFSFLVGLIAPMLGALLVWIYISGKRLKQLPQDLREMDSGPWLLSLIGCGTVVLPILTSLVLGTDLPSLWAFQGIFLFVVVIVCGARYRIARRHVVNVAVLVATISSFAVIFAAPLHAIYRNQYGYQEGRNFYRLAALEVTRRWHETTDVLLTTVSGGEGLAYGTAFYSADHPYYVHDSVFEDPRKSSAGWIGLCFAHQVQCVDWLEKKAVQLGRPAPSDFEVQTTLFNRPGVKERIVALIVPPSSR